MSAVQVSFAARESSHCRRPRSRSRLCHSTSISASQKVASTPKRAHDGALVPGPKVTYLRTPRLRATMTDPLDARQGRDISLDPSYEGAIPITASGLSSECRTRTGATLWRVETFGRGLEGTQ